MDIKTYPRHANDVRLAKYRERLAAKLIVLSNGRVAQFIVSSDGDNILQATTAPFELTQEEKIECFKGVWNANR